EGRSLVERRDRRVVPLGDVALEDLREGGGIEVELLDALDVEDHRDGRDVGRDVEGLAVGGAAAEGARELLVRERRVRACPARPAADEGLAAGTGTARVVVDSDVGVGGREGRDPGIPGGALRRRARAVEGAGQRAAGRLAVTGWLL